MLFTVMDRPSHWIIASSLIAGPLLWFAAGQPGTGEPTGTRRAIEDGPEVVRLPRPTSFTNGLDEQQNAALHSVQGRVVDRLGWPVLDATVSLLGGDERTVRTDGDGAFTFEIRGPLLADLIVQAPGRHSPIRRAATLEPMEIVLQDAVPWAQRALSDSGPKLTRLVGEGYLRDADGPIPDACVAIPQTGAMSRSDRIGRFTLPMQRQAGTLVAWDARGKAARAEFQEPKQSEGRQSLTLPELNDAGAVRGRLLDDRGLPISDTAVLVQDSGLTHWAETDTDGVFVFRGLSDTVARVEVLPRRGLLGLRRSFDVTTDTVDLGDLALERATIEPFEFRVVDLLRAPVASVHVVADQGDGLRRAYGRAGNDGGVALTGLGTADPITFEVRDANDHHRELEIYGYENGLLIVGN